MDEFKSWIGHEAMKTLLLLIVNVSICQAQTYTLPGIYFDSLSYEVQVGRTCDSIQSAQAVQIEHLESAITAGMKSIELKDRAISALQASAQAAKELGEIDRQRARKRLKTANFWKWGATVLLVVSLL